MCIERGPIYDSPPCKGGDHEPTAPESNTSASTDHRLTNNPDRSRQGQSPLKVLRLDSSARGAASASRRLADALIERLFAVGAAVPAAA